MNSVPGTSLVIEPYELSVRVYEFVAVRLGSLLLESYRWMAVR